MVPWLVLLRISWGAKLSRKLESLSQTHLVHLRLGHCHPMVAQHLRALAELLSLLLSPPLYWLHPRHSHSPLFLLADQLLHLWNLVNARLSSRLSDLHHLGRIPKSCRKPCRSRHASLRPVAGVPAVPLPHARPFTWLMNWRVSCRYLRRHSWTLISAVASQHCLHVP